MKAEPPTGGSADLLLARILRPWGRRGEVAAEILTDFPDHFASLHQVLLCDGHTAPRPAGLRSFRLHLGQAILHFQDSDSISDAERLRGCEVRVPLGERLALPPGRYYITDLMGCEVWEMSAQGIPSPLGAVSDVRGFAEVWHLVVEAPAGEVLIPLAAEICKRIDVAARRIEVRLPEGLRELNG